MLNELIPGVSGSMAIYVICVVVLSETIKNLLGLIKTKSGKAVLSGFYVLIPLLLSVLCGFISYWAKGCTLAEVPQQIATIFGCSIAAYEVVVKRLPLGAKNVDESKVSD